MGAVYQAEDTRLKRQVAVKVMHSSSGAPNADRERLLREARAAAAIEHDNVVSVLDVGDVDGIPFLVMPLLKGESLKARIKSSGQLPTEEVVRIGQQIAAGLEAAHGVGLVHRDIKPENIWLDAKNGEVKLLDFGLVRSADNDSDLTHEGVIVGTPLYMSPEQALAGEIDNRTDLFSLGGVLYRAATGQPAFIGKNPMHTTVSVITTEPRPARDVSAEVPAALSDLIGKLLQKDPAKRFQSASEVGSALAKVQQLPKRSQGGRNRLKVFLAAGAAVVMLGIVIIIKNSDGTETRIEVSDTAKSVVIENNGEKTTIVPNPTGFKTDREIAQWLFENGASVWVRSGSVGRSAAVNKASKLVKGAQITRVDLAAGKGATESTLLNLGTLRHLEHLTLTSMQVTLDGMKQLKNFPKLSRLELMYVEGPADAFSPLSDLKSLLWLRLSMTNLDGAVYIAGMDGLETLALEGGLTDGHMRKLAALPNIKSVSLDSSLITDDTARVISGFPKLQAVSFRGCQQLNDPFMKWLAESKTLESINLKGPRTSDRGVEYLQSLKTLKSLSLQHTETTSHCIDSLLKLEGFEVLGLRGNNIDDDFIRKAALLKSLTQLSAISENLTDASLKALKDCKLTKLTLESSKITKAAAEAYRTQHPSCIVAAGQ